MAGLGDAEDRALWRQWRARGGAETLPPDALTLAAYAEGRLDEAEAETVELWLAAHPDALADIAAVRAAAHPAADIVDHRIIAKACALVAGGGSIATGKVVPLRRVAPQWRNALAWSSVAASLVAASLVGFAMGSDAYQSLSRAQAGDSVSTDSLDAPATPDFYFSDDSST